MRRRSVRWAEGTTSRRSTRGAAWGFDYVVHTGSRNLGKQVVDHHQNLANGLCNRGLATFYVEKGALIARYKKEGRKSEIQNALLELKKRKKHLMLG